MSPSTSPDLQPASALRLPPERLTLSARMRALEDAHKRTLPPRSYTVLRMDGRGFSTYTRGLRVPFDAQFAADMDATAVTLCTEIAGAVVGFVASDEISVVLTDFTNPGTQPWFGANVAKMVSMSAAVATATFNQLRPGGRGPALFDSRVFTVPTQADVLSYLLWRQRDTRRNAVSMAARAHFSHRQTQGRNGAELVAMLADAGVDFETYPEGFRAGRLLTRVPSTETVTFTRGRGTAPETTEVTRHRWTPAPCPQLGTEEGWAQVLAEVPVRPDH